MVDSSTLGRYIDTTKKGIIVVGVPRSGTHYFCSLLCDKLSDIGASTIYNGELLYDKKNNFTPGYARPDISVTESNLFELDKILLSDSAFTVTSVTTRIIIDMLFYNDLYANLLSQFTIIMLTRNDILQHFMSFVIHNSINTDANLASWFSGNLHSSITDVEFLNAFPNKVAVTHDLIAAFLTLNVLVKHIPANFKVEYNSLIRNEDEGKSHLKKNSYGVSPSNFFTNVEALEHILLNQSTILREK